MRVLCKKGEFFIITVQTIMESLSEAISQLILYVISMQETNANPPPHIPQAAVRKHKKRVRYSHSFLGRGYYR